MPSVSTQKMSAHGNEQRRLVSMTPSFLFFGLLKRYGQYFMRIGTKWLEAELEISV